MYKLGAVACMKNETEYNILEWVEFYLQLGVEHFWIYDNNETPLVLAEFIPQHICNHITHIVFPGVSTQMPALNHWKCNYADQTEWIMSFDFDEFLCLLQHKTIVDFIGNYESFATAIQVNWQTFGSSGVECKTKEKQVNKYLYRLPTTFNWNSCGNNRPQEVTADFLMNGHTKPLCKAKEIANIFNPHNFNMKIPNTQVNVFGEPCGGINTKIENEVAYLFHYYTRSREEFLSRQSRGCAFWGSGNRKSENFFNILNAHATVFDDRLAVRNHSE